MPQGAPTVLGLPDDELPEITDAGVGLTLLMVATLMADRERNALMVLMADAAASGDWTAAIDLQRRLAAVPGAIARMSDVARAGIERFDAGLGDVADGPSIHARERRALVRVANWIDRRFWAKYATVRPVMPPAAEPSPQTPVAPPPTRAAPPRPKACRKAMRGRLYLLDDELIRLSGDPRPAAGTARIIMTADRNSHAARCRACGACRLATAPLTRDIPTG